MKVYRGTRRPDGCVVTVNGVPLDPRPDLGQAPGSSFEWGYDGAGPSRLALAILAEHFGDDARAIGHFKRFRTHVIAEIEDDDWAISTEDIETLLAGMVEVPLTLAELLKKARNPL